MTIDQTDLPTLDYEVAERWYQAAQTLPKDKWMSRFIPALTGLRENCLTAGEQRGREAERAEVVAWLRSGGAWDEPWPPEVLQEYPSLADAIEARQHKETKA